MYLFIGAVALIIAIAGILNIAKETRDEWTSDYTEVVKKANLVANLAKDTEGALIAYLDSRDDNDLRVFQKRRVSFSKELSGLMKMKTRMCAKWEVRLDE